MWLSSIGVPLSINDDNTIHVSASKVSVNVSANRKGKQVCHSLTFTSTSLVTLFCPPDTENTSVTRFHHAVRFHVVLISDSDKSQRSGLLIF